MRFARSLWAWAKEDRTWPFFALLSLIGIVFGLVLDIEVVRWAVSLVGLWAGFALSQVAFRVFRWRGSIANLLWGVTLVVAVAGWFGPRFLWGTAMLTMFPVWVQVGYETAFTFLIGFGAPARAIVKQRSGETHRS